MNRRQRYWTFGILAFSLNLVPILASGGDSKSATPGVVTPKSVTDNSAEAVKAAKEDADKFDAEAKDSAAKLKQAKADAVKAKANALVIAKAEARMRKAEERKAKTDKALAELTRSTSPAKPAAHNDLEPAPPSGPAHEVTLAEMSNLFMAFDARFDGAERAILIGRVFNNCKDKFVVTTMPQGCGNNPAFKIVDKGAIDCMKSHKDSNDLCTDETCTYVSQIPGASLDLSTLGDGNIQLLHANPNGNEDHKFICENFPRGLYHTSAATIAANSAKAREDARNARIQAAEDSFRSCRHTMDELAIARQAEGFLATTNHLSDAEQARALKSLDEAELRVLANRAAHEPLDDLDSVRGDVTTWANEHPEQCSKVVEPLREIARRQATHKVRRTRDSAENPLQGYDDAMTTIDSSMDEADCLGDNDRLAAMRTNLDLNRVDQMGTLNGTNSIEFRTQYLGLAQQMQQNWYDACASGMDQMSCGSAQSSMQSLNSVYTDATQADQRRYQSMMTMRQMQSQLGMQGMAGGYSGTSGSSNFGFGHL